MALLNKIVARVRDGTFIQRSVEKLFGRSSQEAKGVEPAGDTYYGERADGYLAKRMQQDYWHLEQETVQEIIAGYPREIRVLDVPFGTGRFVPYYIEKDMDIHGMDASEDMVDVAKRELGEDFSRCTIEIGDAAKLPYEDAAFDVVLSFRFLSHVVSAQQAKTILREFKRVCRSDLLIQLRVRRDDVPPGEPPKHDQSFGDRLTLKQIREEFEAAGLLIEKTWRLEDRPTYYRAVFLCKST
jgi:hypothetical protein